MCVPNGSVIIIITTTTTTIIDDVIRWETAPGLTYCRRGTNALLLYNYRRRGDSTADMRTSCDRAWEPFSCWTFRPRFINHRVTCRFRCSSVCVCVFSTRSNVMTRRVKRVCVRRYGKTWSSRSRKAVRGVVSSEELPGERGGVENTRDVERGEMHRRHAAGILEYYIPMRCDVEVNRWRWRHTTNAAHDFGLWYGLFILLSTRKYTNTHTRTHMHTHAHTRTLYDDVSSVTYGCCLSDFVMFIIIIIITLRCPSVLFLFSFRRHRCLNSLYLYFHRRYCCCDRIDDDDDE